MPLIISARDIILALHSVSFWGMCTHSLRDGKPLISKELAALCVRLLVSRDKV